MRVLNIASLTFLLLAALLPATLVQSHPDVIGTRFVAPERRAMTGDCDSNHRPVPHTAVRAVEGGSG